MPYEIRFPKPHVRTKVINSKFVACGVAAPGHRNLLGSLVRGNQHVVAARTLREPTERNRNWLMVFDLHDVAQVATAEFTLVVSRLLDTGQLKAEATLDHVRFQVIRRGRRTTRKAKNTEGVTVQSPSPNAQLCNLSFPPYGVLTEGDTNVESAKLYEADGTTLVDVADMVHTDPDLFWCAAFDEVPAGDDYILRVEGNVSYSDDIYGLDFDPAHC